MVSDQAARLKAVKRKLKSKRGHPDYARLVLEMWIEGSECNDGIEGASLTALEGEQHCHDCGEYGLTYVWQSWPAICPWCSFARFENGGNNPRKAARAEKAAAKRRR